MANKLDTKDVISDHYDLKVAKEYERKIDNSKYFSQDKGDLGKDVSDLFQVGRNGIDAAFLSKGPPPKLTIIESKASDSASFSYSDKQKRVEILIFKTWLTAMILGMLILEIT